MEKEIRNIKSELRNANGRHIEGYAIMFNSQSEDMGFYETIEPSAIDNETIKRSDVLALFDHNQDKGILARSRNGVGNLKLTIDKRGLKYEFDAMQTPLVDEVLEYIRNGIVNASSFAFSIAPDGDKWERRNGKDYRTITKIERLYDVSCVLCPAYSATSCSCRSYENFKREKKLMKQLELYIKLG